MKNLGKILLFIGIFIGISLYGAEVSATVDNTNIQEGESVTLHLKITGSDISRPSISMICGSDIESSSSQTSIEMINMEYKKSYILSYKFSPTQDCTIEPIEFKVDSETVKTKAIKIKIKPYIRSKDDDFMLTLKSNKNNLYVGETFEMTLTLKQKKGAVAVDSKFVAPKFDGFWLKHESEPKHSESGENVVTKVIYTLAPQRTGELEIKPAVMSIASRIASHDTWGSFIQNLKWKKYLSNKLTLNVKALPKGIKLVGDFTLNVRVDKTKVKANEALNLVVEVSGYGNLEDIESFKPSISGVSTFAEKINIDGLMLTQKIALVADSNYTIPPFTLLYFDPKTKTRKLLKTKKIVVEVENAPTNSQELVVKKEKVESKQVEPSDAQKSGFELDMILGVGIFFIGIVFGILVMVFKGLKREKKKGKISLKDDKTVLIKLMPYKEDSEVAQMIETLEKSLYSTEEVIVDRKKLQSLVKRYLVVKSR
jgi:hypothetical protein